MSWWQRFIMNSAVAFFATLASESPKVQAAAKPIAKQIFDSIRIVWPGDPDFK